MYPHCYPPTLKDYNLNKFEFKLPDVSITQVSAFMAVYLKKTILKYFLLYSPI